MLSALSPHPLHPAFVQVSLGLVLPTLLAWQLQSRMAASIAAQAELRQDSAMLQQVRHSQVRSTGISGRREVWLMVTGRLAGQQVASRGLRCTVRACTDGRLALTCPVEAVSCDL